MTRIGRFDLSEISVHRLLSAINSRLGETHHNISWNFSSSAHDNRKRLHAYHNKHIGKRCFIVANGPSLNKTNLELLSDEITFGLNRIYLSFQEFSFRPTYYVAVNELILEQFSDEISALSMPKFLNWNRRSCFDHHDPTVAFLKSKHVINDFFQSDISRPLVVGATVTFVALQIAFYLGFHTVILVGLDHNYVEKGVPNKTETRMTERDESHFHPNYFPKGVKWQLPDLLRSELDFEIAKQTFETNGRKIFDATKNGKCEVFEKRNFEDLF